MTNRTVKYFLLASLFLLASISGKAQLNSKVELPRGVVIEKVACQKTDAQSYALYLPTNYTPEKKWAILYAFDPFGNGKSPVEIFRDAAEKYDFIIVGSNDSRNNLSAEKLSEIITAFWTDTHARFSIDEKRAYAAGLSGGARVANFFAASCRGCIAGVVACGATFTANFPLDKPLGFAVFGTVGTDDFNYPELVKAFEKLSEIKSANRLDVFDGRHGWLPKELAFDALAWLDLQAMKTGRMDLNEEFAAELFTKQMNRAQAVLQAGDVLRAARIYETIARDFSGVEDTKDAAQKPAEIRAGKAYKKALDEENDLFERQQTVAKKIISTGAGLIDVDDKGAALQKISAEIETWRVRSKAAADSNQRRLARRILTQILIETSETALYVNERQKDYKTMIANLELARLGNPQSSYILFELARAYALDGQKRRALDALEQAVENNFTDCARIDGESEWAKLRGEKQFQKVMERLKCLQK